MAERPPAFTGPFFSESRLRMANPGIPQRSEWPHRVSYPSASIAGDQISDAQLDERRALAGKKGRQLLLELPDEIYNHSNKIEWDVLTIPTITSFMEQRSLVPDSE